MARNKELSTETRQSILVLRNEGYSMREIAKKLKIWYSAVYYSLHRAAQTGLSRIERGVGGPGAQLSKRISTVPCKTIHPPWRFSYFGALQPVI